MWHKIKEFKPDITSITCLFSVTHNSYKDVCFELKNSESLKINNLEEIPLLSGGVHISHDPENILSEITPIDIALLNEAELSFLSLIEYQNKKTSIDSLSDDIHKRKITLQFIKIDIDWKANSILI